MNLLLSNVPKILFNSWGSAGFLYNQYLKDISSTGCTFVATHTGDNAQLQTQNINLIATDYLTEQLTEPNTTQIYTAYHNMAKFHLNEINKKNISIYEVELTPDIYYIDRKAQEDSQNVVYELASLLDIEGIKLPGRLLLSKNCPFTYRGEGCLYERSDRLNEIHSGIYGEVQSIVNPSSDNSSAISTSQISPSQKCLGLQSAPPVANQSDQTFNQYRQGDWRDREAWQQGLIYNYGNYIHIEKNNIKYYFVCKENHTADLINSPPNTSYWEPDACSKTLHGCRLRWRENINFEQYTLSVNHVFGNAIVDPLVKLKLRAPIDGNGQQLMGILPFGGFPSVEGKFQSQQGPQGG